MHYKVFYRMCAVSIFLLIPLSDLHAASVPENTTVEMSYSQQIFEQAKVHHDGDGVPQDFSKAYELYYYAAQLGNVDAKVNLGYMLFVGEGREKNYYDSRAWYKQAAAAGDADAIATLEMMDRLKLGLEAEQTAEIEPDSTEAQTEFPDALTQEPDAAVIAVQETVSIQNQAAVLDAELGQAVTPQRSAFRLPAYLFYLIVAAICLGAGYLAVMYDLKRRKRLRRKRFKIASYAGNAGT